jgi:hypothetical protein
MFNLPEVGSWRFSWLAESMSLDELGACPRLMQQFLPGSGRAEVFSYQGIFEAKLCLLGIYNAILVTGVVPQNWHRTKVVPIVKLMERMAYCLLLSMVLEKEKVREIVWRC